MKETMVLEIEDDGIAQDLATPGLWINDEGALLVRTHKGEWISHDGTHGMTPTFVRRATILK